MPEKFTNLAVDCSFFRFHCGGEPMMTEGPGLFYYISTTGIGFDRAAITSVLWYGASSLDAPSCVVAVASLKGALNCGTCPVNSPPIARTWGEPITTRSPSEVGNGIVCGFGEDCWSHRQFGHSQRRLSSIGCWVGAVGNQGATLAS
jgi:hypothetical protein